MRFTYASTLSLILAAFISSPAVAKCSAFHGSTMDEGDGPKAEWRIDYPERSGTIDTPWLGHNFDDDPQAYMDTVLSQVRPAFKIDDGRLVGVGGEQWWMSLWMDYTSSGRERRMGLTKERGPDTGDLAPGSSDDFQVWAVGFYNAPGATVFGEIFAEPCEPSLPVAVRFPPNTVSIKFLFTDADPDEVTYLQGAPEFKALIDPTPASGDPVDRVEKTVRLLQLDIAVKDRRASATGWVFGTFAWVGPNTGDGLFDNLVPVSLQWGDDPGVYDDQVKESWINPDLDGVMYGWDERPTLGFNGRANGPADNIRSSCLSCHASARTPRSSQGILGFRFDMENDLSQPDRVKTHVNAWFRNQQDRELFSPNEPAVASLDYSLQLDAAIFRMCRACRTGDLTGATPRVCRQTGFYNRPSCNGTMRSAERGGLLAPEGIQLQKSLRMSPPPRQ